MEVKPLPLEQVTSYGFCSLQHWFRFVKGFPWYPASYTGAVSDAIRDSVAEWFRCQLLPTTSKIADTAAYKVFKDKVERSRLHFRPTMAEASKHGTDFMLGVLQINKIFSASRDKMVGFDVPAQVTVGDIEVTGTVDVIYRYMAGTNGEHFVLGTFESVDDPYEDLVNYRAMRRGFAVELLKQSEFFERTKPIRYFSIPMLRGRVKSPWDWERIEGKDVQDFRAIVTNVSEGIRAGVAIPTGHPERCSHCPYKPVCRASVVTDSEDSVREAREVVVRNGLNNPFWRSK